MLGRRNGEIGERGEANHGADDEFAPCRFDLRLLDVRVDGPATRSVCVVIVNYNGADYVKAAIDSVLAQRYAGDVRVVVVDNCSTDDSLEVLRRLASIEVIANPRNVGFGGGANRAAFATKSDFVAFLNPDALADSDWLAMLIPWMNRKNVDFASCVVRAGSGIYFARGRYIVPLGTAVLSDGNGEDTDWISGCALVARSSAFREIGGFDERFFLYSEDVDLSLRARRAGFRIAVMPASLVDHPSHGMSTDALGRRKAEVAYASRGRLIAKHVPRRWHAVALAFAATLSPLRNGVRIIDLPRVTRAVTRGYAGGLGARGRQRSQRRPKIGVLANIYEAGAGIRAGGHLHFIEVVKRWTEYDVVVFAPEIARGDIVRELPHVRFEALPSLTARKVPKAVDFLYRSLGAVRRLRSLRECDALMASSHLLPDVLPALLARRPMTVVFHHLLTSERERRRRAGPVSVFGERLSLLVVRLGARSVVAVSQLLVEELRVRGFRMPATVSSNGVDHLPRAESPLSEIARSGAVYVGRLHPAKNLEDALRAWSIVIRTHPLERFTIIGAADNEAYARELMALGEKLGLGASVCFAGQVDDRAKLAALASAKAFLFPSREEGWGIALAEAMRAGLPCVTYDLPIFREVFPVGRLEAALGDHAGLAKQLLHIFGDGELWASCARDASELAATFTWERVARLEGLVVAALVSE